MRLLVCSLEDYASVNIRDELLAAVPWVPHGVAHGHAAYAFRDSVLMTVPRLHLRCDDIDREAAVALGVPIEEVVFLSRHKSASGKPSLTVHPIGNWGKADHGGRDGTLVPAAPHLMTSLLRQLKKEASGLDFDVTFEVTHHGPLLGTPTLFIEIGSSEATWGDRTAAQAIARSLVHVEVSDHPVALGIGGGHYAPRFTESCLAKKVDFGHMLPNHAFDLQDTEGLKEKIRKGMEASGTRLAYIHRRSMKRSEATTIARLVASLGYETVDSSDFEDIEGAAGNAPGTP